MSSTTNNNNVQINKESFNDKNNPKSSLLVMTYLSLEKIENQVHSPNFQLSNAESGLPKNQSIS